MTIIASSVLDHVLALQLSLAWAGEGRCQPSRLGWWQTDLVDASGGDDLLRRLLPRTHAWAGLQAAREAARRVDAAARGRMTDPDKVRSLFHFGFEVDERLGERLQHHKRSGIAPAEALGRMFPASDAFSRDALASWAKSSRAVDFRVVPGGRQLKGEAPDSIELMAENLTAALLPWADQYPLPFYRAAA